MFNVEEMNLMCIFNTGSKVALVGEIRESMPFVYDPELLEIMEKTAARLDKLTDAEFSQIIFAPDYDDEQED